MIKILQYYITKTIVMATALTTLILASVLFLITILRELRNLGEGDYHIGEVIFYVFMRLPNELYHFSPMLILLGSIIGLSILSSHKELAVMRTSGFSIWQIICSVLGAALLLTIGISILGEWMAPNLNYKAAIYKETAKYAGQAVVTGTGVWFHVDNNFIHVQQVIDRQLLEGVTRYQFDNNHHLQAAYFAKHLSLQNDQWVMKDGRKTIFYPNRTKSQEFKEAPWDLKFNSNLLNLGLTDPNELSLHKLAKSAAFLERNGLRATEYWYEFWQRIFQPLASLIMIFLAIPFVLSTLSTSTLGWRIVIGVIVGFVFFIFNAFLGQLSIVFQLSPMYAAFLPLIGFAVVGVFLSAVMLRR